MKLGERLLDGDGSTFVVHEVHDFNPVLSDVHGIREVTNGGILGESRHVARIPAKLLSEWLKEAGVKHHDTKAAEDVLRKKLMSGEFSHFRNWEGTF